ncbi:MAG: tRNA synthetase class [Solirubrobacteraceae bacterium]|jgi:hypothetical protein|nr:tRNA synthetase class [Solirubrobacteraceae bacterium]MEA2243879.1 tRNA synthetase class [Solirubrobacteraceae bacterium]
MQASVSTASTETGAALRAVRTVLAEQGMSEVLTPRLVAKSDWEGHPTFGVAGGHVDARLATSTLQFLLPYHAKLDGVYAIGPVFRPEENLTPNRLHEFHLIEAVGKGSADDALALVERILSAVGAAGSDGFAHLSTDDAFRVAGTDSDHELDYERQLKVVASAGDKPVVIRGLTSMNQQTPVFRDGDGVFDVLVPHAGEVGTGGELLTGADASGNGDVAQALSSIGAPSYAFVLCFERLLQSAHGVEQISSVAPGHGKLTPLTVDM